MADNESAIPLLNNSCKGQTVLIVDDVPEMRDMLTAFISEIGLKPVSAENGAEALSIVRSKAPDLIISDVMMPLLDGETLLRILKNDERLRSIPVILISGLAEMEQVARCIERGADDYIVKPFRPVLLKARVNSCLDRKSLRDQERYYLNQIEDYSRRLERIVARQVEEITTAQHAIIAALASLSESRDDETGAHILRIRDYCRAISSKLEGYEDITEDFNETLYHASPLHDIGKVGIPDNILLKPGKLEPEEFEIMKTHTVIGANTLEMVNREHPGNDFILMGMEIARYHHERWDGSGYPDGLSGANIPLSARIVAIADVYDALTSKRCYKEAYSHENSAEIIISGSGKHFDPHLIEIFNKCTEEFQQIRTQGYNYDFSQECLT